MVLKTIASAWSSFVTYEANFNPDPWSEWAAEHVEIPIYLIGIYLLMVFELPKKMDPEFRLSKKIKYVIAVWNAFFSIFSTIGFFRLAVSIYYFLGVQGYSLHDSVCLNPDDYEGKEGPGAFWLTLFVFSKIPELLDTFWLVIQRKKVIFLHWFHHVVTLLFCWHAFSLRLLAGSWFAIMNYGAHMFMYAYYCAMTLGMHKYVVRYAPFITLVQISQMVGGIFIVTYTTVVHAKGNIPCYVNPGNLKCGLGMYAIFFYHFCVIFAEKYLTKADNKYKTKKYKQEIANGTKKET